MENLVLKENLSITTKTINSFSVSGEMNETRTRNVNDFLDDILLLQKEIEARCAFLEKGVERFEKMSWKAFNSKYEDDAIANLSEEEITIISNMSIEDLILDLQRTCKEIHLKLLDDYNHLRSNLLKGYFESELDRFKIALDDFEELYIDLYSTYVTLPNDKEFENLNDSLNKL